MGERYQIAFNSYKPFPCGVVIHPAIDGSLQLRSENHLSGAEIDRIELLVNPLVLELTGKKTPQIGLEAKFSGITLSPQPSFMAVSARLNSVTGPCGTVR